MAHSLIVLTLYENTILTSGKGGGERCGMGWGGVGWTYLLDERVRGEESVVLLCELFDEVLVLVELFQVLHRHVGETDLLSLFSQKRKKRKETQKNKTTTKKQTM